MLAGLVLPPCCGLASLKVLEDHNQRQTSLGLFDMHTEHKAHLSHCVSYQKYGFNLGVCVPVRLTQVQAGATFVLCVNRGKVCCRFAVKCWEDFWSECRSAARRLLSLMAGDSFNWGWGAVCTAQFCPH